MRPQERRRTPVVSPEGRQQRMLESWRWRDVLSLQLDYHSIIHVCDYHLDIGGTGSSERLHLIGASDNSSHIGCMDQARHRRSHERRALTCDKCLHEPAMSTIANDHLCTSKARQG